MNSDVFLACSKCHEMVIKSVNGEIKIRTKILLLSDTAGARAVCRGCGEEIPIPAKLDTEMVKSMARQASPPLYLRTFNSLDIKGSKD